MLQKYKGIYLHIQIHFQPLSDSVVMSYTIKPANVVTSIKHSPVLKGHLFLVLL